MKKSTQTPAYVIYKDCPNNKPTAIIYDNLTDNEIRDLSSLLLAEKIIRRVKEHNKDKVGRRNHDDIEITNQGDKTHRIYLNPHTEEKYKGELLK